MATTGEMIISDKFLSIRKEASRNCENYDKPQWRSVSWPRFKPGTWQIRSL